MECQDRRDRRDARWYVWTVCRLLEGDSCIFQDPRASRAYLSARSAKGFLESPRRRGLRARSTEDELYYRERQRARRSRYGQEFANYVIICKTETENRGGRIVERLPRL